MGSLQAATRGPTMNDSTQDVTQAVQGPSSSGPAPSTAPQQDLAAQPSRPAAGEEWSDAANDPGSGVPGGGRHRYASGKTYCGTEN
jgi:hypothetical protein